MISEYVSIAHPDRMADLLAAKIIDDVQSFDKGHAAIEVLWTFNTVVVSGEVKTDFSITKDYLKECVQFVLKETGYLDKKEFAKRGLIETDFDALNLVNQQSPDIALGTDNGGWNDQTIAYGGYDFSTTYGLQKDKDLARRVCDYLFDLALRIPDLGTDIKVKVADRGITVAIPMLENKPLDYVKHQLETTFAGYTFTINGTGKYEKHGPIADTGLTGRKVTVNSPSIENKVGGGSMIKPAHASDLLLPLWAKHLAYIQHKDDGKDIALSSTIGLKHLDGCDLQVSRDDMIEYFQLYKPRVFYEMVKTNFVRIR